MSKVAKRAKQKTANLQPHPLGEMFPSMSDHDYKVMVDGMKKTGFDPNHPIVLLDGMILDGNHRYTAAKKAGVKPTFKNFNGDDPFDFVIQENLGRRNLTPSQASMVAQELVEKMKEDEKRLKEAEKAANKGSTKPVKAPKKTKGSKASKAAKALGVSERNVAAATALKKADPELAKEVKSGKKTLHKAVKESEDKKSAAQKKSEEFEAASKRIDGICGEGFSLHAAKKLTSKEILQFSGLDKDEMKRIRPFIEAGWKLKAALGYKSQNLSYGHTIRQLRDRAIEQGGRRYKVIMDDGWEFEAVNTNPPVVKGL